MKNNKLVKRIMALFSATAIALTMGGCGSKEKNKDTSSTTASTFSQFDDTSSEYTDTTTSITTSEIKDNSSSNTTTELESQNSSKTETSSRPNNISSTSKQETSSKQPSTSSTTSSKPSSTSSTTSTPSANAVEKLTVNNINNIAAIDAFANVPYYEIYNVDNSALITTITYTYNGKKYTCEKDEFRFYIALLNEQYLTEGTLKEMFGDMSQDDFKRCRGIFRTMSYAFCNSRMTIDFDQFIVDSNVKNFLNELQSEFNKYKTTGEKSSLNAYVDAYYKGNNKHIKYKDNIVLDYYLYTWCSHAIGIHNNYDLESIIWDYMDDSSTYNSYVVNDFYNKTRNKQLTK